MIKVDAASDVAFFRSKPRPQVDRLSRHLVESDQVLAGDLAVAHHLRSRHDTSLPEMVVRLGLASDAAVSDALAALDGTQPVNPFDEPPQDGLVETFGAAAAIQAGVLPWRNIGNFTVILCREKETFQAARIALVAAFGPVKYRTASQGAIESWIVRHHASDLADSAESHSPTETSCNDLNFRWIGRIGTSVVIASLALLVFFPTAMLAILAFAATTTLVSNMALRVCAAWVAFRHKPAQNTTTQPTAWPTVSLLVPLHREEQIAEHLVARLQRLSYPRAALDVLLILEEDDDTTEATLAKTTLPQWMRVLRVPKGSIQTKPRAMNYALSFAKGSLVGIYDAEDAPEPLQLQKMVTRFEKAGPDLACLQARLAFYNVNANWLSRCFAIEYAIWFRVILPGLVLLRLPIPLGGTSLFFRRDALDAISGWDAHNVTEDADLGFRLARAGYKTDFLDSTTYEEANNRAWPWVRQRSRWLKGYLLTWLVHMRNPRSLWKDLGGKGFAVFNIVLLGTVLQFILAPVLWTGWALAFGWHHPVWALMSQQVMSVLIALFVATEAVNILLGALASHRAKRPDLIMWTPTLMAYFPLATIAIYKALIEIVTRPFYWDKTTHGVSQATETEQTLESQGQDATRSRRSEGGQQMLHSNGP